MKLLRKMPWNDNTPAGVFFHDLWYDNHQKHNQKAYRDNASDYELYGRYKLRLCTIDIIEHQKRKKEFIVQRIQPVHERPVRPLHPYGGKADPQQDQKRADCIKGDQKAVKHTVFLLLNLQIYLPCRFKWLIL